jgi:hypothetical protein
MVIFRTIVAIGSIHLGIDTQNIWMKERIWLRSLFQRLNCVRPSFGRPMIGFVSKFVGFGAKNSGSRFDVVRIGCSGVRRCRSGGFGGTR